MNRISALLFLMFTPVMLLSVTGCQCSKQADKSAPSQAKSESKNEAEKLSAKGKTLYLAHCIACHNANPKAQGSLGPDVYGSSKELLTARILHAAYPEGYTPKRASKVMPALPHLSNDLDALTAFLNQK